MPLGVDLTFSFAKLKLVKEKKCFFKYMEGEKLKNQNITRKIIIVVIIIFILFSFITGSIIYFWQRQILFYQISILQNQIDILQKNKEVKVSNIILNEKDYHGDMTPCKGEYFKIYENNILGISFIYQGNIKSYIKEENGKLQFVNYSENTNKYYPNPQDYIEIYQKISNDNFNDAVEKLIAEETVNIDKCMLDIKEEENQQILTVSFVEEPDEFDVNKCLPEEGKLVCYHRQIDEYTKIAYKNCSNFEEGPYGNFFIYQPQNSKNKIVFVRHTSGLDAPPWDTSTIKLFDN